MTRAPDPANPQPGDRFTNDIGPRSIVARQGSWCWVVDDENPDPMTVSVQMIARHYRPVLPPLITEPVTLHHWMYRHSDDWGLVSTPNHATTITGRKIELRPDGTWSEVTT